MSGGTAKEFAERVGFWKLRNKWLVFAFILNIYHASLIRGNWKIVNGKGAGPIVINLIFLFKN